MSFLIDTNVISEVTRPKPNSDVIAFLHEVDEDRLFMSVITIGELRRGVALKAEGKARSALDAWLRFDLVERFSGRIIDITPPVAERWGELMAAAKRQGVALHVMDGFLAATALTHNHTLVTRNVRDFRRFDVPLLNPWDAA
ncbi:type II toxin-antitoxin system VapC family toxin [Methylocystis sp. ATCC 49242]|uniref:type II toxin-antitoxin system VapC family toxin n=1 Tax=Methylocystis sp. ATCC 49242 TaxID=622637 RepID=UPI0001F88492|nr:type II toxin-antitoxin system VapC family toxin [Methylocystis sp. ATCC 49242]